MGCTGCKKKTYKEYSKQVDKSTTIAIITAMIFIGLSIYGLWALINNFL